MKTNPFSIMEKPLFTAIELLDILFLSENATAIYSGEEVTIQSANAAMLKLWGKDSSIIGLPMAQALPELKGQDFIEILQEVWHSGITYSATDVPARLVIDGWYKTSYFDFTYRAIKNADGKTYCILHTTADVTTRYYASTTLNEKERTLNNLNSRLQNTNEELAVVNEELRVNNEELLEVQRRQAATNEKLRDNEHRLQSILDTMAEGIGITDSTGRIVYVNRMAQHILGLTESDITERTYHDPRWQNLRVDGTPLPGDEHPMAITVATGKPVYDCEIAVQPPDRERFYISINATPLYDAKGNITGGIGTFMDVTARRKDLQSKDDFISIASHELKTPLTSLKASLQMLDEMKEDLSSPFVPRLIDQGNKSMDKMIALVEELLDSSKLTQGNLQLHKSTFVVADLLNESCSHVRMAGTHQLVFQGDLHLEVMADRQRIDQVVVNFVNNAVKYASESPDIFLIAEQKGNTAKVSVRDSGPGIAPDKIAMLFNRYYQIGGSKGAGLGLGLYICSEIIKKHGGEIGVDSAVGVGSTFWFTLPL